MLPRVGVQTLVWELRSYKPCGAAKFKKKKTKTQQQTNLEGRGLSYREAVSIKAQGSTVIHCSIIHNSPDMEKIH